MAIKSLYKTFLIQHSFRSLLIAIIYSLCYYCFFLLLTVTVVEVLPKDKKGKEEKINILGQSCIDLLPLLHGEQLVKVEVFSLSIVLLWYYSLVRKQEKYTYIIH